MCMFVYVCCDVLLFSISSLRSFVHGKEYRVANHVISTQLSSPMAFVPLATISKQMSNRIFNNLSSCSNVCLTHFAFIFQ